MIWTTQYPTQPGYYWIRNYKISGLGDWPKLEIVLVAPNHHNAPERCLVFDRIGDDRGYSQRNVLSAEWLGPISPPDQPNSCPVIGHSAACNCHHGDNIQYIRPISPLVEDK